MNDLPLMRAYAAHFTQEVHRLGGQLPQVRETALKDTFAPSNEDPSGGRVACGQALWAALKSAYAVSTAGASPLILAAHTAVLAQLAKEPTWAAFAADMATSYKRQPHAVWERLINQIGHRIATVSSRPADYFSYYLIDNEDVTGDCGAGHIVIDKSYLQTPREASLHMLGGGAPRSQLGRVAQYMSQCGASEDALVSFVLAHEIAHSEQNTTDFFLGYQLLMYPLQWALNANALGKEAPQRMEQLMEAFRPLHYGHELSADRRAVELLSRASFDPLTAAHALNITRIVRDDYDTYTHPSLSKRIEHLGGLHQQ